MSFSRVLGIILTIAVLLRIALILYVEHHSARFDFPDSRRYVQVARNIADGNGPIDSPAVRAGTDPLYPAILSLGISFGLNDTPAILRFGRTINSLCALASVILLALIARRLIGPRAALIAATLLAIDPILLFFNGLVLTESLYIMLLLAAIYFVTRLGDHRPAFWALLAGLALGLGAITRSTSLFLSIMMLPYVWRLTSGNSPARVRAVMIFMLGFATCLSPIVGRNFRLFGHFVPVRTGGGASLLEAFGPWADGGPGMDRIAYPPAPPDADEYLRDRINREAAVEWIRQNPANAIRMAWTKLMRMWSITINAPGYSSSSYRLMGWATVTPIYVLSIAGIYFLRRRSVVLALCLIPAVYFSCVHMIFVGSVRYRLPVMPLLFLLAGAAIDRLWRGEPRSLDGGSAHG
jgi:hypothetical protein